MVISLHAAQLGRILANGDTTIMRTELPQSWSKDLPFSLVAGMSPPLAFAGTPFKIVCNTSAAMHVPQ